VLNSLDEKINGIGQKQVYIQSKLNNLQDQGNQNNQVIVPSNPSGSNF